MHLNASPSLLEICIFSTTLMQMNFVNLKYISFSSGASIFRIHSIRGVGFLSPFNVISTVVPNHCHLNLFFTDFSTVFKFLSSASIFNSMGDNDSYERSVRHYYLMFLLSLCEGKETYRYWSLAENQF